MEDTPDITAWVVTEGIAGTENQCLGVVSSLGINASVKRINLKLPWKLLSPYLRIGGSMGFTGDRLSPPWPDLLVASGRKSIEAALYIKKASGGRTFIVQVQDPRIDPRHFDLVIVPQHDPARGPNVLVTTGALHRVTPEKLAAEGGKFLRHPSPRVAVLIGGSNKSHKMTPQVTESLAAQLKQLAAEGASLLVTVSRRTGAENAALLRRDIAPVAAEFYDGGPDNPYFGFLADADYILVTEDSVSMASEAISTGKPVMVIPLEGGAARLKKFHALLQEQGYTRPFTGRLETWSYTPPRDTERAADEIRKRMRETWQRRTEPKS